MIHRSSSEPREDLGLSAACGLVAWAFVVGALTIVADPLLSGASFAASVCLAWSLGRLKLIIPALVSGLFMIVLVPLVVALSGGAAAAIDMSTRPDLSTAVGILGAFGAVLRVPALIAASLIIISIPGPELVRFVAGWTRTGALMAAVTGRFRFRLAADAVAIAEEARAAGNPLDSPQFLPRWRARVGLVEAFIASSLDRAFEAGEALESRGFGAGNRTGRTRGKEFGPWSAIGTKIELGRSRVVALLALGAFVCASAMRLDGVPPPGFDVFAGATAPVTPLALCGAALLTAMGVVFLRAGRSNPASSGSSATTSRDGKGGTALVAGPPAPRVRARGRRVELDRVSVRRRVDDRTVVGPVDLEVERGEHVRLDGPSGSGKSSLLAVIGGYIPFHRPLNMSGAVVIGGRDVTQDRPAIRARSIASVFQESQSQSFLSTVWDEVAFAAASTGRSDGDVHQQAVAVLRSLNLVQLSTRKMWSLSSGETQAVMLACALVRSPDVLLLDEPCASLDAEMSELVNRQVSGLREYGSTVVFTEHANANGEYSLRPDRAIRLGDTRAVDSAEGDRSAGSLSGPEWVVETGQHHADARLLVVSRSGQQLSTLGPQPRPIAVNLSIAAPAGSAIAVLGPNGAGKTTFLRSILGLTPGASDALVCAVDGISVQQNSQLWRLVGWVPQRAGWGYAGATIAETVGRRISATGQAVGVEQLLADAGLGHVGGLHPLDISVGERQRLGIVLATLHRPPVWLLDEPSRGMDPVAIEWLISRIALHCAHGGVIVFATHDTELVEAVASHAVWVGSQALRHGITPTYRRTVADDSLTVRGVAP